MRLGCTGRQQVCSAPLCLLVEGPQLQIELKLGILLLPLLHRGQPVPGAVEGRCHHLELAQACFVDVLLLHNVQLWRGETPQMLVLKKKRQKERKTEKRLTTGAPFEDIDHTCVVSAAGRPLHKRM